MEIPLGSRHLSKLLLSAMGHNRGLALVGFMGAGKSTVGRALADRLGCAFVDTDEILETRFGAIAGQVSTDEASFRSREAAVVQELCDGVVRVLATGGGVFVSPDNRRRLQACYTTVHLAAPLAVLRERVAGSARPLWDADVEARWRSRQSVYELADIRVDTSGRTVDEVVDAVLAALGDA